MNENSNSALLFIFGQHCMINLCSLVYKSRKIYKHGNLWCKQWTSFTKIEIFDAAKFRKIFGCAIQSLTQSIRTNRMQLYTNQPEEILYHQHSGNSFGRFQSCLTSLRDTKTTNICKESIESKVHASKSFAEDAFIIECGRKANTVSSYHRHQKQTLHKQAM